MFRGARLQLLLTIAWATLGSFITYLTFDPKQPGMNWVNFMSLYACITTHWTAYLTKRIEEQQKTQS